MPHSLVKRKSYANCRACQADAMKSISRVSMLKKKSIIDSEFTKLNSVSYNKYINFYEYVYINSLSYCV